MENQQIAANRNSEMTKTTLKNFLQAQLFNVILESKVRVGRLKINEIIQALDINPEMTIADIGAGTGLFSRSFAKASQPSGTVYAVETNPLLLKKITKTAEKMGIDNLKGTLASYSDFNLPEQVDLIFMCDVLHHVDDKMTFLQNVPKYLKKDGRLALIDFSDKWPPFHKSMRFTKQQCNEWTDKAGLTLVDSHDFLRETIWSFFHVYKVAV